MSNLFFNVVPHNDKLASLIIKDIVNNRGSSLPSGIGQTIFLALMSFYQTFQKNDEDKALKEEVQKRVKETVDEHGLPIMLATQTGVLGQKAVIVLIRDKHIDFNKNTVTDFLMKEFGVDESHFTNWWRDHDKVSMRFNISKKSEDYRIFTTYFVCDESRDIAGVINLAEV